MPKKIQYQIIFCCVLFIYLSTSAYSQKKLIYYKHRDSLLNDSIITRYSENKKLHPDYMLSSIISLSYYNELDSVPVKFIAKRINTIMASRPQMDFIFRKKENRVYRIFINTKPGLDSVAINMPLNARIGIFAHEYAHIIDYMDMSNFELTFFGIKYLVSRKKVENRVDKIVIDHGIGWQLYELREYLSSSPYVPESYLRYVRKYYMKQSDVLNEIEVIK